MNKVAIITGASRGIGATTAELLAQNCFAVCINYHSSEDKAHAIVNAIEANHGKAIAIKADMACEDDIIRLFKQVDQELGPITALVNNAGTNGGICEVENMTMQHLQKVFATNVFGTFYIRGSCQTHETIRWQHRKYHF